MSDQLRSPCAKCGGTVATLTQAGPHTKASCAACGAYCYFAPKPLSAEHTIALELFLARVDSGYFSDSHHLDFADSLRIVEQLAILITER